MNWEDYSDYDTILMDIDSNGLYDLEFKYKRIDFYTYSVNLEFEDAVTAIANWDFAYGTARALNAGDTITPYLNWGSGSPVEIDKLDFILASSGSPCVIGYGGENFSVDNYLAIKLNIDGAVHFGWVRLSTKNIMQYACDAGIGSPLVIYDYGYNATPDEAVVCDAKTLPEEETISEAKLIDNIDADIFSDLQIFFKRQGDADFSQIRFYLVPDRNDVIHFSAEQALSLDAGRYFVIDSADMVSGNNTFALPADLLDINGGVYSSDNYYSAFYLKIPVSGDTARLSLSAPLYIKKAVLQRCLLEVSDVAMSYDFNSDILHVEFQRDADDADISAYAAAPVWEQDIQSWYEYGVLYYDIDTTSLIIFPKSQADFYDLDLTGVTKDITGNDLESSKHYRPAILGLGDGFFRDLLCVYHGSESVTHGVNEMENGNDISISQSYFNILHTHVKNFGGENFTITIRNIEGNLFHTEKITSPEQNFSFPEMPAGVYLATITENSMVVAAAKIVWQQ